MESPCFHVVSFMQTAKSGLFKGFVKWCACPRPQHVIPAPLPLARIDQLRPSRLLAGPILGQADRFYGPPAHFSWPDSLPSWNPQNHQLDQASPFQTVPDLDAPICHGAASVGHWNTLDNQANLAWSSSPHVWKLQLGLTQGRPNMTLLRP